MKSLLRLKHSCKRVVLSSHQQRSFSALPDYVPNDYLGDLFLVEGRAKSRAAILNRASALNALSTSMVARLKRLHESWEENPDIGFVLMKGSGRAFCSGGDAVALYQLLNEGGNIGWSHNGMRGRDSLKGMFRLVTDKTVFANPEIQMGFLHDAGASFYLSCLPGYLGKYLALTREKLNGRLAFVEERLGKLITDEPSVIDTSVAQYGDLVYPDRGSVLHKIETIDKCFSHDTVEEIIDALENEAAFSCDEWCTKALRQLKEASPLSLKVTLRSIREGRFQSLDQCLVREYGISLNGISKRVSNDFCEIREGRFQSLDQCLVREYRISLSGISNDFCEGIRASLVDKDFAPKWDPPILAKVSKDMIDCYLSPFDELEPELDLPTAPQEPYM